MATFQEHIEGLTGLSIGTSPTTTELSGFLVDGLREVVNRIIFLNPREIPKFTKTTNAVDSVVKTGQVLTVMREHDSTSILRKCTQIDPNDRYNATDSDSLHYRSKYNPGFYELNGLLICVPEAAGSGDNDIVVTQVYYDTGLINSDEYNVGAIDYFPDDYEYLVATYAAIKSLQNALSAKTLPSFTLPTAPVSPALVSTTISESSITSPEFIVPIMGSLDYADANTWINTEEDSEMLEARIKEIDMKISDHQARLQESVAQFNKENAIFQKNIQIAMGNAQFEIEDDNQKISKFAGEVQNYGSQVHKEVQRYQSELQQVAADYGWMEKRMMKIQQDYDTAFQLMVPPRQQQQGEQ